MSLPENTVSAEKPLPTKMSITSKLTNHVEPWLFSVLRSVPFRPQKFLLEHLLQQLLLEPISIGELEFLSNKTLKIVVNDAGVGWRLSCINNQLKVQPFNGPADAIISGNAKAFVLLASRQEDPDTLFFHRKLNVEGDTELGLEVKNFLDSLEIDMLPSAIKYTFKKVEKFKNAFAL